MYSAPGSAEPLLSAASGFAIASADASGAVGGRGRDRDRSYRQGGGERDIDDDDAHGGPMRAVPHHHHGAGSTSSGHSHHSPTRQEYRLVHAAEQRSPNDGSGGDVDVDNDSDVAPGRHLMSGVPSPMRLGNSVGAPSDSVGCGCLTRSRDQSRMLLMRCAVFLHLTAQAAVLAISTAVCGYVSRLHHDVDGLGSYQR